MTEQAQFSTFSRILHWAMAVMIVAMLFIGIGMVASLSDYHWLVSIHKPLGIAILILVAVRLINRLLNPAPPLPQAMPALLRFAAHASHLVLYGLMFALPLVGWAMLSAARYPIVLYGPLQLPPILPQSDELYAALRLAHTALADACSDLQGRRLPEHGLVAENRQVVSEDGRLPARHAPVLGSSPRMTRLDR
jgi:cytochrome b561